MKCEHEWQTVDLTPKSNGVGIAVTVAVWLAEKCTKCGVFKHDTPEFQIEGNLERIKDALSDEDGFCSRSELLEMVEQLEERLKFHKVI